jgi:hypothetical protein
LKFKLIPIDFDRTENEELKKAINIFNASQKVYFLDLEHPQKFSEDANISWEKIYGHLLDSDLWKIAITSKSFVDNWFSHTENKVTVISTADWRRFYSPPGLHCYLLLEFILTIFFQSSNFGEIESEPHEDTTGCLLDLCLNKKDIIWKLKTGYICPKHTSLFLANGGTKKQLKAIRALLYQIRKVTLGISYDEKSNEGRETIFTIDSIKKHPLVVAGIIFLFGLGLGWGFAHKIWIEPNNAIIERLENELEKYKNNYAVPAP